MNTDPVLDLVKAREGISTSVRDSYLSAIINGVIQELQDEKGIDLRADDPNHLMYVVDYVSWRYNNRDAEAMPRHLQFRLHNLLIQYHKKGEDVSELE